MTCVETATKKKKRKSFWDQYKRGHEAMRVAKRNTEKEAGCCTVWMSGVHTELCLVHWWLWRIH